MISVEKMEQIALKRRERNRLKSFKRAIRRVNRKIKQAYRRGEIEVMDYCDYEILKDLQDYYESKGFFIRRYGGFGRKRDFLQVVWGDLEHHAHLEAYAKSLYRQ